jgi:aspartate aminotransferase
MAISKEIESSMEKSSWIRKMFEEGERLKKEYGAENVYDFSLGNPDLAPPEKFYQLLSEFTKRENSSHRYMPNKGFPQVCEDIARKVSADQKCQITGDSVVMTVGAAGGLNTVLKTLLDPGDEVIVIQPYFVEYNFYILNHRGVPVAVDSTEDFGIDAEKVDKAITEKTKAVIINSPNNPTGRVYSEKEIESLIAVLQKQKQTIYLISDEPYREILYTDQKLPSVLKLYEHSFFIYSYSKSLSIPGERIGYIVVPQKMEDRELVLAGLVLSTRILGYVNAPALMQRVVAGLESDDFDLSVYKKRMDLFYGGLTSMGYEMERPGGGFYLFVKVPGGSDVDYVNQLMKFNILAVPGSGFGRKGYMRLAFCVEEDIIERALPKFRQALDEFNSAG